LVSRLRQALAKSGASDIGVDQAPSNTLAMRIVGAGGGDIQGVVVDLSHKAEAISLIANLAARPNAPAVYATALAGTVHSDAQAAARAGARRVFQRVDDFPRILEEQRALSALGAKKAQLILFAPAQDGAGASTAALHTAANLAKRHHARTLLAEIDYYSDSVAYRLRLPHAKSLADLGPKEDWRAAITEWNGLDLLAAPTSTRALRTRGLPELARAVGESCHEYDYVVGDLPCNIAVFSPAILAEADRIYVVATAEVTSLYLARRRVLNLVTAGACSDSIRLIVNRDRPGAVDSDLALQVTGFKPDQRLPNDFAAASAAETDAGVVDPGSPLGRAYAALAADIVGKGAPAEAIVASGWGRLLAAWR